MFLNFMLQGVIQPAIFYIGQKKTSLMAPILTEIKSQRTGYKIGNYPMQIEFYADKS